MEEGVTDGHLWTAHSRTAHTPLLSLSTHLTVSRCYMVSSHHWGRQLHTFSLLADFSLACPKSKCSHIRRSRQLCDRLNCRPAAHLWARHTAVTVPPHATLNTSRPRMATLNTVLPLAIGSIDNITHFVLRISRTTSWHTNGLAHCTTFLLALRCTTKTHVLPHTPRSKDSIPSRTCLSFSSISCLSFHHLRSALRTTLPQ